MSYFIPQTMEDILKMKQRGDAENSTLEFKSSRIFEKNNSRVFDSLSKETTAFANALGGILIIGIEENSERQISEIVPIQDASKSDSWLEDGLLPSITPNLKMSIEQIEFEAGHLIVIDVPASRNGPHQASDMRYYARRLFRVDPLLAFEVDDIRRRILSEALGANLSILFKDSGISFSIENEGLAPIFEVSIEVEGVTNLEIAKVWTPGLNRPYTEPFKIIHPGETRNFLGAGFEFFQQHLEDQMDVSLHYVDEDGKKHQKVYTYYLKDFHSTFRQKEPNEDILETGVKRLESIEQALGEFSRTLKSMQESAFHPSGLNLSKTTLTSLSNKSDVKWPGEHLNFMGLSEILEVSTETALQIQRDLFGASHYMGGTNKPLEEIDLPEEVKDRIRQRLILPRLE